jgi:hypothetical protein
MAKPRRAGKIVALLAVAAAAAGAAAYYLTQQQGSEQKEPAAVVAPAPAPAPKKVRLALKSDPAGAAVLRRDTNERLGITPFDIELAASKTPIELLFKKESFRDKAESFVPEESGQLAVALLANPPVAPTVSAPAGNPAAKTAPVARRKAGPARHSTRSMDEDGVLAPSF